MDNFNSTSISDMLDMVDDDDTFSSSNSIPTAPIWYWIVMTFIAMISFWAQATVTEERFVPALNVIANEYNIPNDIAGATLMAAGASSPELFSSFVALFITHSALGLGTIVGSEIFNQLIICAGAVFASRTGTLQLDRAIVTREVGFYGLSIVLLYIALHDRHPADDDAIGDDHIFINFFDAIILFGGYIAYVGVCAKMDDIVALFSGTSTTKKKKEKDAEKDKSSYGAVDDRLSKRSSFDLPNMPFLREAFGDEPASNFTDRGKETYLTTPSGVALETQSSMGSVPDSLRKFSDGHSLRKFIFQVQHERPSDEHDIHDIEFNAKEGRISFFMYQRSFFYNKARFGTNGWHLRWFSFKKNERIESVPNRANYAKHVIRYPKFPQFEFDDTRLIIRIPNPKSTKRREFFFMCPSEEVFDTAIDQLEKLVKSWKEDGSLEDALGDAAAAEPEDEEHEAEEHVDLTAFPEDGSMLTVVCFFILFPLRFIMQWTIGDVRTLDKDGNPTATRGKAYCAIIMCLVWLIVGSYAMVASLEELAALMDIPDAVVGVTVSAAGTSLPNYVASKVAAQKGFGNMAVSNAFGSNTFNIMVGLGLPWVLYIASTGLRPYHALHDDGITMSVIILGTVLAIFVVLVVPTGFVLYRWHGWLFIFLYISYLAFAIGQVYL